MVSLTSMPDSEFHTFAAEAIARNADICVRSGRWPSATALERSRAEMNRLLPQGMLTPAHYFMNVLDAAGNAVGTLWWGILERTSWKEAFIYDLHIAAAYRRKGYAKEALQWVVLRARELGLDGVSLQVYEQNEVALALYASSGFFSYSRNMRRPLG